MYRADKLTLIILATSLIANAIFGYQVFAFRRLSKSPELRPALKLGEVIDSVECEPEFESGQARSLMPRAGAPLLIYSLASSCGFCQENAPVALALASKTSESRRFIGLCLDENLPGCRLLLAGQEVCKPTSATRARLQLGSVPQTIALSSNGAVERVWTGKFASKNLLEIEEYFNIRTLPR